MLTLPNYEILEESFRGVTCTLYRAKRQDDHKHVLLKQPTARFSREMSGVRLRHEYEVAHRIVPRRQVVERMMVDGRVRRNLSHASTGSRVEIFGGFSGIGSSFRHDEMRFQGTG